MRETIGICKDWLMESIKGMGCTFCVAGVVTRHARPHRYMYSQRGCFTCKVIWRAKVSVYTNLYVSFILDTKHIFNVLLKSMLTYNKTYTLTSRSFSKKKSLICLIVANYMSDSIKYKTN